MNKPRFDDRLVDWVCAKSERGPLRWLFVPLAFIVIIAVIFLDPKHYEEES